jgi:hypothetical protein
VWSLPYGRRKMSKRASVVPNRIRTAAPGDAIPFWNQR